MISAKRSGRGYVAESATADPTGRRLRVEIEASGPGVTELSAAVEGATTAGGHAANAR